MMTIWMMHWRSVIGARRECDYSCTFASNENALRAREKRISLLKDIITSVLKGKSGAPLRLA